MQLFLLHNVHTVLTESLAFSLTMRVRTLPFQCPKRVVHRDLKSPNVLVSNSVLKICDFGHSLALTMSIGPISGLVGTPCWMAPESIR